MPPPPPLAGYWHSLLARHASVWRAALKEASKAIKEKLPQQAQAELQPILVRNAPKHPVARIRQAQAQKQARWFSTSTRRSVHKAIRQFTTDATEYTTQSASAYSRAALPKSNIANVVNRQAGRAPFASSLRPNLTGGTLGRTAGGYSLGAGRVGGVRHFSHGPANPAHIVQNVSQAVRAFVVGGQKAQFAGVSPRGEKRYQAVSTLQQETGRKVRSLPKATPGSYIEFSVNPTITALTSLSAVAGYSSAMSGHETEHINTDGLLNVLSVDFSRALKDLAAVLNDLNKISRLGDLPITYQGTGSLRVHFPGCDADSVERLCEELSLQRGVVVQDEEFDAFAGTEIALLFPFAPSTAASDTSDACELYDQVPVPRRSDKEQLDWHAMLTPSHSDAHQDHYSMCSETSDEDGIAVDKTGFSSPSTPSGYESLHYSSGESRQSRGIDEQPRAADPLEYQGFEGIYRFLEQCDAAERR